MSTNSENGYEVLQVPVVDLHGLWASVKPGIEMALRRSANEATMQQVEHSLFNGIWDLWVVANGEGPKGFAVTEILRTGTGEWLNVPFAFSLVGLGKWDIEESEKVISEFLSEMEYQARGRGMRGVKFISCRRGWSKIASKLGYEPRFVEYTKEL